jgi:UDP:flavonoid glycosyltransferase YjiC (YdhE family)
MPLAFEQSAIAARMERAGVGRVLSRRSPARRLAAAIGEVLGEERYRESASAIRADMAAAGGARRAADLIESELT